MGTAYDKWLTAKPEPPDRVECNWCRQTVHIGETEQIDEGPRHFFICHGRCLAEFQIDRGSNSQWPDGEEPHECPHCKADLRDHKAGPPNLLVMGKYDPDRGGVTSWYCPFCMKEWERK